MPNQLVVALKEKLNEIASAGSVGAEELRNAAKEELQYYVLNFIYNHPEYGQWTMYGGSALRVCHNLNRMSVDLDFEISHACSDVFLEKLKKDLWQYFSEQYDLGPEGLSFKVNHNRGLTLRFIIGDELPFAHPSKQIHVKIDLNHFILAQVVTERFPINHSQLSFVIKTYNMSALMASKIAAVVLRGKRGVGKAEYEEKGRDIYDLLWYMERKIVPDLDYLQAKGVDISNLRALFDRLTIQMNKVSGENLVQDLTPLFLNQNFIRNWLAHWHESYLQLVSAYDIQTVTDIQEIVIHQDFRSDNYSFIFVYNTESHQSIRIIFNISDYWFENKEGALTIPPDGFSDTLIRVPAGEGVTASFKQYAILFLNKINRYLAKTNNVILGRGIETKFIRMTADNLNQKEQIVLNKSALISCELEDLLK